MTLGVIPAFALGSSEERSGREQTASGSAADPDAVCSERGGSDMRQKGWALILTLSVMLVAPASALADDDDGDDGGGFLLGGAAQHAQDPENPANDVIKIDTTSPAPECNPALAQNCIFGTVSRTLNIKIGQLDNMLEFKAYFQSPRVGCGGGSPRIQLAIDLDGDGVSNGNAHGNFGPLPFGGGCQPPNTWDYQDLTDAAPRWDVTQLIAPGELVLPPGTNSNLVPWPLLEMLVSTFSDHLVCSAALVDDSGWFPPAEGPAYYDLFSAGRATWVDQSDTAGRGFAMGCGQSAGDDEELEGDHDHDHDVDDDDIQFDQHRREQWGDD
jgi:hypothetical protein